MPCAVPYAATAAEKRVVQHLECDAAIEHAVARRPHHAHAALPQPLEQDVPIERRRFDGRHRGCRGLGWQVTGG